MLEFYRVDHHIIGGNHAPTSQILRYKGNCVDDLLGSIPEDRKYYETMDFGFKLDERWKQELSPEMLEEFDSVAGKINREMGYGSSHDSEMIFNNKTKRSPS